MLTLLTSLIVTVSASIVVDAPQTQPLQNVCCVLPTGQQCCSSTTNSDGRPLNCGC